MYHGFGGVLEEYYRVRKLSQILCVSLGDYRNHSSTNGWRNSLRVAVFFCKAARHLRGQSKGNVAYTLWFIGMYTMEPLCGFKTNWTFIPCCFEGQMTEIKALNYGKRGILSVSGARQQGSVYLLTTAGLFSCYFFPTFFLSFWVKNK